MAAAVEGLLQPGGYPVSSSAETTVIANTSTGVHVRQALNRGTTDQILSYYQSELAGRPLDYDHKPDTALSRRGSSSSRSSSEYSSESLERGPSEPQGRTKAPQALPSAVQSQHARRPSVPTQESTDRRRLAIVELDKPLRASESERSTGAVRSFGAFSASTLLSRRGLHIGGLALVAPADASPSTYTNLTPPPTAPIVVSDRQKTFSPPASFSHTRSASEVVSSKSHRKQTSPRDVGIVGFGAVPTIAEVTSSLANSLDIGHTEAPGLQVPIFQTPSQSRPPSPAYSPSLPEHTSMTDSLLATSAAMASDRATASTPAIGEGKDIAQPVVGPVVVGLDAANVIRREQVKPGPDNIAAVLRPSDTFAGPSETSSNRPSDTSIPSRAGSLPLPPNPVVNIQAPSPIVTPAAPPPRPPRSRTVLASPAIQSPPSPALSRDTDSLKEPLQPPQSLPNTYMSRAPVRPEFKRTNTNGSQASTYSEPDGIVIGTGPALGAERSKSIHRREGAFPPSVQNTSMPTPEGSPLVTSDEEVHSVHKMLDVGESPLQMVESPELHSDSESDRRSGLELRRKSSWISLRRHGASSPSVKETSLRDPASVPNSPSGKSIQLPSSKSSRSPGMEETRPSSTGGSSNPFKATLNSLKRFSALPRTPSSLSIRSASQMLSTPSSSRTPSPAATPRQKKIINSWPEAMQFRDISAMKSPSDRAAAYAQKIQELSMCDTGLSDWLRNMQSRGNRFARNSARNSASQLVTSPILPSSLQHTMQPRHTSHGSVDSEATFPVRPDAYTATDLTMRPSDDLSVTKVPPPALPYPSLAMSPPQRAMTLLSPTSRSYQIPLASGPTRSATGFFASIGRKASLRKDRQIDSPPSPARVLTKRSPHLSPPLRTNQLQMTSPSIPGGPRAQPGKIQRSHTMAASPVTSPVVESPAPPVTVVRSDTRTSLASRRPSLFNRSPPQPQPSGPEFDQQVDKLADLLPHAERSVLAGYLRRAGQDILAIGQYLEDQKKGTIRHD